MLSCPTALVACLLLSACLEILYWWRSRCLAACLPACPVLVISLPPALLSASICLSFRLACSLPVCFLGHSAGASDMHVKGTGSSEGNPGNRKKSTPLRPNDFGQSETIEFYRCLKKPSGTECHRFWIWFGLGAALKPTITFSAPEQVGLRPSRRARDGTRRDGTTFLGNQFY